MCVGKPRVLFLSTSIPPLPDSQTIRNVYLLRGLAGTGAEVDVVAPPAEGGDATLLQMLPEGVRVHRTAEPIYDRVQRRVADLPLTGLRPLLRSAVAVGAGIAIAPDVRRDWSGQAERTARRVMGSARPDLLVSSSGSSAAHIAASRLAAEWGTPWLAEYGDPWSLNPIRPASWPHIRWQNERLERRALRACRAMSVTTDETAEAYRSWGSGALPIHVVPCGYSEVPLPPDFHPGAGPEVTISYVGTAARGTRNLGRFLQALSAIGEQAGGTRVNFQVVGSYSPAFDQEAARLGLRGVSFSGWVAYEESLVRMGRSDLLLLYGNAVTLQVPAKVHNYIRSGRPIFYVGQVPAAQDPTRRLLDGLPGVVFHQADEDGLEVRLRETLADLEALGHAALRRREMHELQDFDWDRIGARFGELAISVAGGTGA